MSEITRRFHVLSGLSESEQRSALQQPISREGERARGSRCSMKVVRERAHEVLRTVDRVKALQIVNAASAAVLEETLQCQERSAAISGLPGAYADIGDFQEAK